MGNTVVAEVSDANRLVIAERLGSVAVWARRKFTVPMSSSAVSTLVTLERSGPLRISELAEREQLTQPGMTTLVNRLEQDRYAERVPDLTDGRATLVRLTDTGRTFIAQRRRERTQALLAEVARLSPTHQAALFDAVDALDQLTGTDVVPNDGRAPARERPADERPADHHPADQSPADEPTSSGVTR